MISLSLVTRTIWSWQLGYTRSITLITYGPYKKLGRRSSFAFPCCNFMLLLLCTTILRPHTRKRRKLPPNNPSIGYKRPCLGGGSLLDDSWASFARVLKVLWINSKSTINLIWNALLTWKQEWQRKSQTLRRKIFGTIGILKIKILRDSSCLLC